MINLLNALSLPCFVSDIIISRIGIILSPSKNICSVLHKPIPSAPNSIDFFVSVIVSAFALIFKLLNSSHQSISVLNSVEGFGGSDSSSPIYTSPSPPSIDIMSPSFKTIVPFEIVFKELSIIKLSAPTTQGFPIPRATTAA